LSDEADEIGQIPPQPIEPPRLARVPSKYSPEVVNSGEMRGNRIVPSMRIVEAIALSSGSDLESSKLRSVLGDHQQ